MDLRTLSARRHLKVHVSYLAEERDASTLLKKLACYPAAPYASMTASSSGESSASLSFIEKMSSRDSWYYQFERRVHCT